MKMQYFAPVLLSGLVFLAPAAMSPAMSQEIDTHTHARVQAGAGVQAGGIQSNASTHSSTGFDTSFRHQSAMGRRHSERDERHFAREHDERHEHGHHRHHHWGERHRDRDDWR
jgi:hypothetical protein